MAGAEIAQLGWNNTVDTLQDHGRLDFYRAASMQAVFPIAKVSVCLSVCLSQREL